MPSIYERALGTDFRRLHPKIQERFGFSSRDGVAAIGRGERTPDDIPAILASRDPRQAEPPAPGTGLTLAGLELDGSHGPAWVTSVEEVELEGISAG